MKTTPTGALLHHAQTRPKSAAFIFHEEVWTYERLADEAERLARGLAAHGVEPGDRVALHMMNRPEMVVAYYACFKLGAIAAPLRTAFTFAELAPMLQRLKPALYIGEIDLYKNVAPVDASILAPDRRFVVNGTFEEHGVQPWEALFDDATDANLSSSPAQYKPAVLINTSGTTGQPKFVVHTPATLSESVDLVIKHWGFSNDDVMIESLPMAHSSGLFSFLSYIQFGAPFVLLEGFDADGVLRQLGVRLVPSATAEDEVEAFGGTRHTSGRRYSFDDPSATVIAVSADGPVTVLRNGAVLGRSPDGPPAP